MAYIWKRCGIGLVAAATLSLSPTCWAGVTGGYMLASKDSILYLRITQVGGKINGYMQIVESDLSKPQGYIVKQLHVTGEASGKSFSLHGSNCDRLFGGGISECEGTCKAGQLLLHFPTNDGRTATYTFKPTSAAKWNSAVSSFQKRQQIRSYVQRWSDALWNRQEQIANDLEEAQQQVDDGRQRLAEYQARLETTRSALAEAETKLTMSRDDLKAARDRLSNAEEATRKAEADANGYSSSDARQRAHIARDSENEALHVVSTAESNVNRAECKLNSAQSDLENAQEGVAKDNAEIAAACARVEEDNAEFSPYLLGHVILDMVDELNKGIVLGTAVHDTEIREHPCSTSGVLYSLSLDKEVPVLDCGGDFCPVLMSGKSLGWIPAKDIRVSIRPYWGTQQNEPTKAAKRNVIATRRRK